MYFICDEQTEQEMMEPKRNMEIERSMSYFYFIAFVVALGGGLYGYDTAVISGTISMVVNQFHLTASMEGTYVGCALFGSIVGVLGSGLLEGVGRKRALILSSILYTVSAVGCTVSNSFAALVLYRVVGGIGIGISAVVAPAYISEIAPARHRGRLVSLYQLAITVGFLAAYVVNYFLLEYAQTADGIREGLFAKVFVDECWRGMLFAETLPAVAFIVLLLFIPESPVWLSMRGSGKRSLLAELKAVSRPPIRKAVLIGAAIAILGQFMGVNAVLYYGPSIFEESGLASGDSLFYQVLVGLVNVVTTLIAFFIIDRVGRKRLVYFGVTGMIVTLLGIAWYFQFGRALSSYILLVFFLLYIFFCAISICAVIFVLLSEMFPSRVRGIAMSIAEFSLWIGTWLIGQLTPVLLETLRPQGTFLLFAVICVPYMLIVWKLIPETTGKSLEEIEAYWYAHKAESR